MAKNGDGDGALLAETAREVTGGGLVPCLRTSYTWIRHISPLRPMSYVLCQVRFHPTRFSSAGLRSTLQTLQTRLVCCSPCHSMQS